MLKEEEYWKVVFGKAARTIIRFDRPIVLILVLSVADLTFYV